MSPERSDDDRANAGTAEGSANRAGDARANPDAAEDSADRAGSDRDVGEAADSPELRAYRHRELTTRARVHWTEQRLAELARGKALLLPPIEAAPLLRTIGLLHRDASMPPRQVRKYWQVSHMVTLLGSALRALISEHRTVRILDAGCGRSYLSLALAWVAEHRWGGRVQILGVDRNPDVIAECRRRARFAQLDHALRFRAEELSTLDLDAAWRDAAFPASDPAPVSIPHPDPDPDPDSDPDPVPDPVPVPVPVPNRRRCFPLSSSSSSSSLHALLSLHACDTATCDALALGVRLGASLIAVAPCCQAELARGWAALAAGYTNGALDNHLQHAAANPFRAIWGMPHLRRETGADLTDAMRALLLRACGYQVSAIEFVPSEHTRKNTMLKAVASPRFSSSSDRSPSPQRSSSSDRSPSPQRSSSSDRSPSPQRSPSSDRSPPPEHVSALAEYRALVAATGGVGLGLAARLPLPPA